MYFVKSHNKLPVLSPMAQETLKAFLSVSLKEFI
jgi:hypothetical protein